MNERIQSIKNQCWVERHWDNDKELMIDGHIDLDKFAMLIVRECLGKIENEAMQYAEPVWAFEIVNDIKEHFGVEE